LTAALQVIADANECVPATQRFRQRHLGLPMGPRTAHPLAETEAAGERARALLCALFDSLDAGARAGATGGTERV
jgi:hypothetical protein